MSKYALIVLTTVAILNISYAEEGSAPAVTPEMPPLNMIESPDYVEGTESNSPSQIQVEKLQYDSLEDGRPPLEKKTFSEEDRRGAHYEAGSDVLFNPDSSINLTHEPIEDSEEETPDQKTADPGQPPTTEPNERSHQ